MFWGQAGESMLRAPAKWECDGVDACIPTTSSSNYRGIPAPFINQSHEPSGTCRGCMQILATLKCLSCVLCQSCFLEVEDVRKVYVGFQLCLDNTNFDYSLKLQLPSF